MSIELGRKASGILDETAWVNESRELAKQKAYGDEVLDALQMLEAAGTAPKEI